MYKVGRSRTPQGVRGLKPAGRGKPVSLPWSHSARSAWIETVTYGAGLPAEKGRTPQGVRGLKQVYAPGRNPGGGSHSARSAWIETSQVAESALPESVALRKECVD